MLSLPWNQRKPSYQFVVIGSGYGGSITARASPRRSASRISSASWNAGQEWQPGNFPSDVPGVLQQARSDANPLGLYEFLNYKDISVIKGSGLGGTSLINANVAIVPDAEVFQLAGWPRTLTLRRAVRLLRAGARGPRR